MNQKGFGPAHDRIDLTDDEIAVIGRLEHDLGKESRAPAARRADVRSHLTLRAHMYYLCMRYRRRAIWLLPVAGMGLAVAITVSLAPAIVCAALWAIGFAALLTEVGASCRRLQARYPARTRAHSGPNAEDGGR